MPIDGPFTRSPIPTDFVLGCKIDLSLRTQKVFKGTGFCNAGEIIFRVYVQRLKLQILTCELLGLAPIWEYE